MPRVPPGSFAARMGAALLETAREAEFKLSAAPLSDLERARAEGARDTAIALGLRFVALISVPVASGDGVVAFPSRRRA
jgi:hypothetical protein